jgi:hypothetical protein
VTVLAVSWHASPVDGVHSFARIGGKLVEVKKARHRMESRRRAGWHTHWYVRVIGGPWRGDERQSMHPTSIASDGRLGFRTMRAARFAGKELAS